MAQYRKDGEVKTCGQIKKLHSNVSFSSVVDTFADLGWEIIGQTPRPEPSSASKIIQRDGEEQIAGKWVEKWIEVDATSTPEGLAALTESYRQGLLNTVASLAKTKRDSGITVSNLQISTDADASSLLSGAKLGGKATRKLVGKNWRIEMSKVEFEAVVEAVDDHIQAVFDKQYDLIEAIDAASDLAALEAIDIESGWPT